MAGKIAAVIGTESHTTSAFWSKLYINGQRIYSGSAESVEWLSEYKDRHASWCECVFSVEEGDKITYEAGSNTGNRGKYRDRLKENFVYDSSQEVIRIDGYGRNVDGYLEGRLRAVSDEIKEAKKYHADLKDNF